MIGLSLLAALSIPPSAFGRAPGDAADVGDLVRQGDSYFRTSRYREALAVYEKARALDPGDVGLLLLTARARRALYDPSSTDPSNVRLSKKAIEDYEAYLAKVLDDTLAFQALAGAWVEAGQEDAAIRYLRERHAGRPSDVETIELLAGFTEKKGDYEESEALLRKRITLEPSNPEAYYRFGVSRIPGVPVHPSSRWDRGSAGRSSTTGWHSLTARSPSGRTTTRRCSTKACSAAST